MTPSQFDGPEQLTVQRLFDIARDEFNQAIKSASVELILWRSFETAEELQRNYLRKRTEKKHLSDKRKRVSDVDQNYLELLEIHCSSAIEYQSWLEENDRQPLFQEVIVRYCTALENFLKKIAVGLEFANKKPSKGLEGLLFIPSPDFNSVRIRVFDNWNKYSDEQNRPKDFFQKFIINKISGDWSIDFRLISEEDWLSIKAAFEIRNAIVHQFGILRRRVQIFNDGDQYFESEKIEIPVRDVERLRGILEKFSNPFCPLRDAF